MFTLITPEKYNYYSAQMEEMYALRYRVFCERLGWVKGNGKEEKDAYDTLSPSYLIYQNENGQVLACVRLLPTTGKNMLKNTFPQLMDGQEAPVAEDLWESSRFAVDTQAFLKQDKGAGVRVGQKLLLAMIEFGLSRQIKEIVTVTDLRIERALVHSGWNVRRLGRPKQVGKTIAVALCGEVSHHAMDIIRAKASVKNPILYQSVL